MASIEIEEEEELQALLTALGVTSVDGLPVVEVPGLGMQHQVAAPLPRQTISHEPVTVASVANLLTDFNKHLDGLGVDLNLPIVVDLLASYLSSQVLLFAGPSGTGKSTAARCLQSFFAPADSRAVVHGRRQLVGPEDVAGYFSVLGKLFVAGPDLESLDRLARPNKSAPCPCLLVEEINLSPPEGYLNPLMHGFSGLSSQRVEWRIFGESLEAKAGRSASLVFEPFPRLLGTINVDATAPAPAPKVTARSCVVLLEPMPLGDLGGAFDELVTNSDSADQVASGATLVFDPLDVVRSTAFRKPGVALACSRMTSGLEYGAVVDEATWTPDQTPVKGISRRQVGQVLLYAAWFDVLDQAAHHLGLVTDTDPRVGAENAVLHFVLPGLGASQFGDVLESLRAIDLSIEASGTLGGLLRSRLERLSGGGNDGDYVSRVLDFWDRLS